jgi:tRNA uridine 5-carbamoylmethylation protein Kti12
MIYLISGTPGSGKSSVAKALVSRFPRGVAIAVDDLREMVVSGMAHPVPTWTEETARQFALARASAVRMALLYEAAGFVVAIDDVISSESFHTDYESHFEGAQPQRILLHPALDTALARNANRSNKAFDTSVLEAVIVRLHHEFSSMDQSGWHVIDSSNLDLPKTVDIILERIGFGGAV